MANLEVVLGEGVPVFSNDGRVLGHVREIDFDQEQFRVDIPNAVDVWLTFADIGSTATGYVRLGLTRSEVVNTGRVSKDRSKPYLSAEGTDIEARTPRSRP